MTGVPEGFFDSDKTLSVPQEGESIYNEKPPKPKHPPKPNTTEALPEGFFDDPVADAKVRSHVGPEFIYLCMFFLHAEVVTICYKTSLEKMPAKCC